MKTILIIVAEESENQYSLGLPLLKNMTGLFRPSHVN